MFNPKVSYLHLHCEGFNLYTQLPGRKMEHDKFRPQVIKDYLLINSTLLNFSE
jgi:hypothetical protein